MSLFTRRRGKSILTFAVLFVTLLGAAVSAQEAELPGVAIYVAGDIPSNEKKVLGTYLLNAIVKAGQGKNADGAEAFLAAATADEHAKGGASLSKARVCELGKQFNIRFICAALVTHAFDFFVISANIVDTETEAVLFKSEAQSPLKTINDITQASNQIVGSMFEINISDAQTAEPATGAPAATSTPAGSVTGDAKVLVDRVVAAVNAFKDATTKSIDAANAVTTAAQSKNFSAIMDAKKKVEDAAKALKRAKTDGAVAIDALNSAGPEAKAAVKAMGIDISMFGGNDGSSDIANFTAGERVATVFMNQAVPGLGSGVMMHDMLGLWMQIGLSALGAGLISGGELASDEGTRIILTGIGIGALSANLTYNIVRSATYRKPGSIKPPRSPRRFDYYISPKYQTPLGAPIYYFGGINIETGLIWGEGGFFGLDLNFVRQYHNNMYVVYDNESLYPYNEFFSRGCGLGLSLGKAYDFGNGVQFVYGMSAGRWFYDYYYWEGYDVNHTGDFLAPFIKLRYSVIEITYRGLLDDGFGYNNHQLMLGFYFATNKRQRN